MSFSHSDLGDDFVDAWSDSERGHPSPVAPTQPAPAAASSGAFAGWLDKSSARHSNPPVYITDILRKAYPNHSLVLSSDYSLNLTRYPHAVSVPIPDDPLITQLQYVPLARSAGPEPGVLVDKVEYGAFRVAWDAYDFTVYVMNYPFGFGVQTTTAILHEGSDKPARDLLRAAGLWAYEVHEEIWVFDGGFWNKNARLYSEVQKANWKDVILKDEFKKKIKKDVYGFFDSEALYKELAIPWKRGIVMHGPPGNGKTISLKAIMKECGAKGFLPLYVRSFRSYKGEEGAMADVFGKARQLSPCVVIFEDLDSLINDSNRSFFLNQLDGLESNDGMLIIGTTNHLSKIDSSLTNRPSRFDRKFLFDNPDADERVLYCQYWQNKLESNKSIDFPDSLAKEISEQTNDFSFAYLKEVFVSSLVVLAGWEDGDRPTFEHVVKDQIAALRKELDKAPSSSSRVHSAGGATSSPSTTTRGGESGDIRALFDALCDSMSAPRGFLDNQFANMNMNAQRQAGDLRNGSDSGTQSNRDVRALLDALSDSTTNTQSDRDVRALLDALNDSVQRQNANEVLGESGQRLRALFEEAGRNAERIFVSGDVGNGPTMPVPQVDSPVPQVNLPAPMHPSYSPAYIHPGEAPGTPAIIPGAWGSRSSSYDNNLVDKREA
ncbi:P-loop containing nucleoside triphosphate hydrolase protein [Schizophyllum commune H4-8]|uniref:AAA+ ATPase domain-containing protein n=1 Tax=Schizophyllum commune (strain H4-8 / FGSC 9210) TaxID=578458 RepID=D8PRP3_SCHCM|nr:P-loop containing nucleoside triphosphate hydrolase protein [Schizophyllum commune H4-8]KAI5893878.1 P-loop containing nucleoside triphosphate hydrolase protein [Schizophyllum commune H4-8]